MKHSCKHTSFDVFLSAPALKKWKFADWQWNWKESKIWFVEIMTMPLAKCIVHWFQEKEYLANGPQPNFDHQSQICDEIVFISSFISCSARNLSSPSCHPSTRLPFSCRFISPGHGAPMCGFHYKLTFLPYNYLHNAILFHVDQGRDGKISHQLRGEIW